MKKVLLLMFIMIMPLIVNAETCDINKLSIQSISVENKSENIEEIEKATIEDKKIKLNLNMSEVGDNIKYKLIINNNSSEDFKLSEDSINNNSDYINYSLKFEDNSNVIKANSSKIVFLITEYKKEVPDEEFESGTYNDNKILSLNLVNLENEINLTNPKTGVKIFLLVIALLVLFGLIYFFLQRKKNITLVLLIIGLIMIVPYSINAMCKIDLKIESKVEITNNKFTGTIYRYNKILLHNGSNIQKGYLLKNGYNEYISLFSTLEECESNRLENGICEKIKGSLLQYENFSLDSSTLNSERYLRHDVENNVIKNSYVCFKDGAEDFCMKGGDNGDSYSSNSQIIKDYNSRHSYCTLDSNSEEIYCNGSYGMKHFASSYGKVSSNYIFGVGCNIESDGSSSC